MVDVNGLHGIELGAVSTGKLKIPSDQSREGVQIGIRDVVSLWEAKKNLTLDLGNLIMPAETR